MLRKVNPDPKRAKSLLHMAETSLMLIQTFDKTRFPSNLVKEYYEVARELITIILLLDGVKASGEGAHAQQIQYLQQHYLEFTEKEIALLEELRTIRNDIAYEGFMVPTEYVERREPKIRELITKLNGKVFERIPK